MIKFPVLEGDSEIYLGQTIVTLVRMGIENNNTYSDETQHRFKVELMASVLSELDVTLDDLKKNMMQEILIKCDMDNKTNRMFKFIGCIILLNILFDIISCVILNLPEKYMLYSKLTTLLFIIFEYLVLPVEKINFRYRR